MKWVCSRCVRTSPMADIACDCKGPCKHDPIPRTARGGTPVKAALLPVALNTVQPIPRPVRNDGTWNVYARHRWSKRKRFSTCKRCGIARRTIRGVTRYERDGQHVSNALPRCVARTGRTLRRDNHSNTEN